MMATKPVSVSQSIDNLIKSTETVNLNVNTANQGTGALGRGARQKIPNITIDQASVKLERLKSLIKTKGQHGAHFTRSCNYFLSVVLLKDIVTLNTLFDKLKESFSVFNSDHIEFVNLATELGETTQIYMADKYMSEQIGRLRTAGHHLEQAQASAEHRARHSTDGAVAPHPDPDLAADLEQHLEQDYDAPHWALNI